MKEENKVLEPEVAARQAIIEIIDSSNRVQEKLSGALKPYNLSIAQFNVLRILRGQKGKPASLNCVNKRMIHKMSNTTRLIDKLLQKGLVERITCPDNRRKIELTITGEGLDLLKELDVVILETEKALLSKLTAREVLEVKELLQKIEE